MPVPFTSTPRDEREAGIAFAGFTDDVTAPLLSPTACAVEPHRGATEDAASGSAHALALTEERRSPVREEAQSTAVEFVV